MHSIILVCVIYDEIASVGKWSVMTECVEVFVSVIFSITISDVKMNREHDITHFDFEMSIVFRWFYFIYLFFFHSYD